MQPRRASPGREAVAAVQGQLLTVYCLAPERLAPERNEQPWITIEAAFTGTKPGGP